MRSRSSGVSDTTTGSTSNLPPTLTSQHQQAYETPIVLGQQRRTTIEDFADTESEASDTSGEHKTVNHNQNDKVEDDEEAERADSINSLLQEYNYRQSGTGTHERESKQFVFKEEFDDSSIKTKSRPTSRIFSAEENEELKAEIMRHGSVRSSGSATLKQQREGLIEVLHNNNTLIPIWHNNILVTLENTLKSLILTFLMNLQVQPQWKE